MLIPAMDSVAMQQLRQSAPGIEFLAAKDESEALALAGEVEGCYGTCSLEFLKAATRLRWVQVRSAGVERYPHEELKRRGVCLTNARGIYGIQLADHTLALILAFSRQLPFLFRAQQRQVWESRDHYPPGELAGQNLLVVGLGGTGLETARRAAGFGLRILATRRHPELPRPAFVEEVHAPERLHGLLPRADWVAVCVPLTAETRDLFGDEEFDRMKRSAVIVCVTRGGILNTEALVRALQSGKIAGAGLDVTQPEPLPAGHPLWTMGNVILTPHASGHSPHADQRLLDLVCDNVGRFARGEPLRNVVDLDLGY
ncbi:MAG: D-2-hydroxyacid dehydrogenase [Planctomycetes bacterium]|nr:D-2-hydroxyacid dehydrogenase [Planctomycetota bacterium]